jgi:hypothetical protein
MEILFMAIAENVIQTIHPVEVWPAIMAGATKSVRHRLNAIPVSFAQIVVAASRTSLM